MKCQHMRRKDVFGVVHICQFLMALTVALVHILNSTEDQLSGGSQMGSRVGQGHS